jgi:hypothetical protein
MFTLRTLQRLELNRQFQLLVYACREGWEVRYHIADYAEKNENGGRVNTK